MLTILPIFVLSILAACLIAAALPLLLSRQLRPAVVGTTGSCCIAGGASLIALLVSGLFPLAGLTPIAAAQEEASSAAAPAPADPSSAPGSGATTPPMPDSSPASPASD